MSEEPALRAAVCAAPDDDLPRLVYADYLEEQGDPERAEFIRDQIEAARRPEWEPEPAGSAQYPEGSIQNLPKYTFPNQSTGWSANQCWRRGFGYSIGSSFLPSLVHHLDACARQEPIGELMLPTATLDQWEELERQPRLRQIESLGFKSLTTPIEPLRVLRSSENTLNVRHLSFVRADSPAWPEMMRELFQAPLGPRLQSLSAEFGMTENAVELFEAIAECPRPVALNTICFTHFGLFPDVLRDEAFQVLLGQLDSLDLSNNRLGNDGVANLFANQNSRLQSLHLNDCNLHDDALVCLASTPTLARLRLLDLSLNRFGSAALRALCKAPALADLRKLALRGSHIDDNAVRYLTRAEFWPKLVGLDLGHNPISDRGAEFMLRADAPVELEKLFLQSTRITPILAEKLKRKFGTVVTV